MFVDQGAEPPADVGGNISAEGRVKPCDVSAGVFFFFFFSWSPFRSPRNSVLSPKPLSARALPYMGLASSNTASLLEMSVSRRLIDAGKF